VNECVWRVVLDPGWEEGLLFWFHKLYGQTPGSHGGYYSALGEGSLGMEHYHERSEIVRTSSRHLDLISFLPYHLSTG
jgi:hypothetical protein